MSICSRIVGRTAEVDTVPRDESPVSLEGERFELPVFSARLAHLYDMRTVRETGVDGNFYKIRTQALIDQKLHGVALVISSQLISLLPDKCAADETNLLIIV